MGKYSMTLWAMAAVTASATSAFAQEVPASAAKAKVESTATPAEDPIAASARQRTYTAGRRNEGASPAMSEAAPATPDCSPTQGAQARTGRIVLTNKGKAASCTQAVPTGQTPSRLSMTPTTTKVVAPAPAQPAKGHSEKGIK